MGGPLSPLARGGTFRRRRSADDMAAGGHRRGFDLVDGSILPGSRSVPTDHTVHGFAARLGLARAQICLITLVLGILVLAQWPVSGLWVIGLFVGIELIFNGGAWMALALDLRSA